MAVTYSGELSDLTYVGWDNGPAGFYRQDASTVGLEGALAFLNDINPDEFGVLQWTANTFQISTLSINAGTDRNLAIAAGNDLHLSATDELLLESMKWPRTPGSANQVLTTDGVDQLSWATAAGSGDVSAVPTPLDNQLAIWTGANTIEGDAGLTFDGTDFATTGNATVSSHGAIGGGATVDTGQPMYPGNTYANVLTLGETMVDLSSAYAIGLACFVELNPSIAPVATTYGSDIEIKTKAGNAQNFPNITGNYAAAVHDGDGNVAWLVGSDSTALVNAGDCDVAYGSYNSATGGDDTYGLYSYADKNNTQPSDVGLLAAGYFQANNTLASTTGTDTTYGVYASLNRTGATGGTVNSYGYYLDIASLDNAGAGTHTAYGIYLEDVTGADTNYAIYSAGGDSFFNGAMTTSNIIAPKSVCMVSYASGSAVVAEPGTVAFSVPVDLNGYVLDDVTCTVTDKGVTGETKVQVRRRSGGVDAPMLTTEVSLGDEFWASDGTVDPDNDDLLTGDQIYIDVTEIHTGTAPNGLSTVLTFRKP